VFSPKYKLMFVERTSMVAHIYPSALQALAGRGRTERLEGEIAGDRGEAMQDLGYELPRIPILGTSVNKAASVSVLYGWAPFRASGKKE